MRTVRISAVGAGPAAVWATGASITRCVDRSTPRLAVTGFSAAFEVTIFDSPKVHESGIGRTKTRTYFGFHSRRLARRHFSRRCTRIALTLKWSEKPSLPEPIQ